MDINKIFVKQLVQHIVLLLATVTEFCPKHACELSVGIETWSLKIGKQSILLIHMTAICVLLCNVWILEI